jgi:hypothetical protein
MAEFSRPPGAAIAICAVPHYRAYIIGPDGHFKDAVNLDCANDAAAIASAKQLRPWHRGLARGPHGDLH